ncbi:hypothetical protein M2152_000403 [Microbacteriaceae bacterium SG_E_30_P1]|uniref:Exo-alpha-sialidase n=1 Tax=Antiquaquibacter oligotrophicus TaxID=2880260 RepID=A0ABT6KKH3_9MICO|nr:hypothetical protein [Antiquaquibacter oligotrophicus]MDH6180221.1 hypothetical protein [Antiquaquibacter oligotrophicus]UDF14032.1 hypothetical protein LH407_04010 [Antiquaquibacter oligotrophicus]
MVSHPRSAAPANRRPKAPRSSAARAIGVILVVLFLLIDVILIGMAVIRMNQVQPGAASPIPSFDDGTTPAPESTEEPVAEASSGRYLSTVDGRTIWRSTLGSCDGPDAQLEYSVDGGATWAVLTTTEMRARQVLALEVVDADTIWVVARAGDSCDVAGFASFTAGEFWEPRPEAVSLLRYVDRDAPDVVHLQGASVPGPCPVAQQAQARDATTTVVCDDLVAESIGGGAWASLEVPGILAASPAPGGHVLAVWGGEGCDGISVQAVPSPLGSEFPVRVGCIPAEDPPADIALARLGNATWAWIDGEFRSSADGGASW